MPAYEFDASGFTPQFGGGGQLPFGKHPVMIVESELAPFANNKGGVKFQLEAIDGPAKGQRQNLSLMLYSPDQADAGVVASNNNRLSAICYVTGVYRFKQTEELHKRPFVVDIGPQAKNPQFMEVKEVFTSDLKKASEVLQSGNAPAAAPTPPPLTATAGPSPTAPVPEASAAPTASPSNWGAPATAETAPAQPWGTQSGGATSAAPWGAKS